MAPANFANTLLKEFEDQLFFVSSALSMEPRLLNGSTRFVRSDSIGQFGEAKKTGSLLIIGKWEKM
jgi:hypothetical protein